MASFTFRFVPAITDDGKVDIYNATVCNHNWKRIQTAAYKTDKNIFKAEIDFLYEQLNEESGEIEIHFLSSPKATEEDIQNCYGLRVILADGSTADLLDDLKVVVLQVLTYAIRARTQPAVPTAFVKCPSTLHVPLGVATRSELGAVSVWRNRTNECLMVAGSGREASSAVRRVVGRLMDLIESRC